jgi:hypothetical protein
LTQYEILLFNFNWVFICQHHIDIFKVTVAITTTRFILKQLIHCNFNLISILVFFCFSVFFLFNGRHKIIFFILTNNFCAELSKKVAIFFRYILCFVKKNVIKGMKVINRYLESHEYCSPRGVIIMILCIIWIINFVIS